MLDYTLGEDGVIVDNRAAIIYSGNIGSSNHADNVDGVLDSGQVHVEQCCVSVGAHTNGGVQRVMRLWNVVGVPCGASDMKGCTFVSHCLPDGRSLCTHRRAPDALGWILTGSSAAISTWKRRIKLIAIWRR